MLEEQTDTLVIGAGPAGLAVCACLRKRNVPFILVEKGKGVGAVWRNHYDRLHLHTNKAHSALPHMKFPSDYPRYPSRDQFVAYMESYAREFDLAPRFGEQVLSAGPANGGWRATTPTTTYTARRLVVATGYTNTPFLPKWPGQREFPGPILHSANYKNGETFRGKTVLVVGFGNSGGEIAIDLHEHGARPELAVRGPVNIIPRELFGIPIVVQTILLSKLPVPVVDGLMAPILHVLYGDVNKYGLQRAREGPMAQVVQDARIPLIDIGTVELIRAGAIRVRPGIEQFEKEKVCFEDGTSERYDAVVLATGYRPRVSAFLQAEEGCFDRNGSPGRSGVELQPGLFFCGFYVAPTGGLREIAREAERIARAIAP